MRGVDASRADLQRLGSHDLRVSCPREAETPNPKEQHSARAPEEERAGPEGLHREDRGQAGLSPPTPRGHSAHARETHHTWRRR